MRIAIDLTATPRSKTGIGRYMLGLLKGLQETNSSDEFFLFMQDDDLDGFGIHNPNFHIVPVNSKILRKQYIRILWEQFVFPFRLRKIQADVLHCPNFTMPYTAKLICRKLAVVGTFHDMTYFFLPQFHVGWKREFFKAYIRLTAPRADKIITISQNSALDIPQYCKLRNKDISVTYMGVKEAFFENAPADDALLSKYSISGNYILYVGTLEPRKNIPGLISGYLALSPELRDQYKLVIIGKKGWMYDEIFAQIENSGIEDIDKKIIFTGYVDDNDMVPIMKRASVFAYVSFYEGFGIPVIEGMASGVTTVTSRGSSLEEVAGDCCILCIPEEPETITQALTQALTEDATMSNGRHEDGIKRAKFFNWKACGEASTKAYREAFEVHNGTK